MTYVILLNSFDNDGWKSIFQLFESQAIKQKIKFFTLKSSMDSHDERKKIINEIKERGLKDSDKFIFVKKYGWVEDKDELTYTYASILKAIVNHFPSFETNERTLIVLDKYPKKGTTYIDNVKMGDSLIDKYGYIPSSQSRGIISDDTSQNPFFEKEIRKIFSTLKKLDTSEWNWHFLSEENKNELSIYKKDLLDKIRIFLETKKRGFHLEKIKIKEIINKVSTLENEAITQYIVVENMLEILKKYVSINTYIQKIRVLRYDSNTKSSTEIYLSLLSLITLTSILKKDILPLRNLYRVDTLKLNQEKLDNQAEAYSKWLDQYQANLINNSSNSNLNIYNLNDVNFQSTSAGLTSNSDVDAPFLKSDVDVENISADTNTQIDIVTANIEKIRESFILSYDSSDIDVLSKDYPCQDIDVELKKIKIENTTETQYNFFQKLKELGKDIKSQDFDTIKKLIFSEVEKIPNIATVLFGITIIIFLVFLPYLVIFNDMSIKDILKSEYKLYMIIVISMIVITSIFSIFKIKRSADKVLSKFNKYIEGIHNKQSNLVEKFSKNIQQILINKYMWNNCQELTLAKEKCSEKLVRGQSLHELRNIQKILKNLHSDTEYAINKKTISDDFFNIKNTTKVKVGKTTEIVTNSFLDEIEFDKVVL